MRVRVLGSAAGGGFPQWNCRCETCEAARAGERAQPRTQSSLAIRGDDGPWFLVNASPDLRQQLETGLDPPARVDGVRAPPIAGVLLTDAEIDHTAGLLLLRESATPVRVFGSAGVERALTDGYPVLPMLERYCGTEWRTLEPGRPHRLDSSLVVEPFPTGGDAPRYLGSDVELEASGFAFRDRATAGVVTYVPGLASLDDSAIARFAASDLVLVDGTFWHDDDLTRLGISDRTARDMGHTPLAGPGGTLDVLAGLERPRKVLVHINNTNPILFEDSAEREEVVRAGVEVAYDGLEVEL
jgi:pyrroloquinoline quinone biosynthesis protein B